MLRVRLDVVLMVMVVCMLFVAVLDGHVGGLLEGGHDSTRGDRSAMRDSESRETKLPSRTGRGL